MEKFGLSAAVLQLVLSGLFLEILEGWTAVSFKFSNGKALGTKLVVTCDAPIHEDLGVIMWYFTHCILLPCSQYLLIHHRFLKIHHFTAFGLVS